MEKIYVRRGGNGTLPCLPTEQVGRIFRLEWTKEERKLVEVMLPNVLFAYYFVSKCLQMKRRD